MTKFKTKNFVGEKWWFFLIIWRRSQILERLKGRSVEIELRSLLKGTANDILFN